MEDGLGSDKKWFVYILIAAVIFISLFNFILIPLIKKNAELNQRIETARFKLNRYTKLLGQKEIFESKFSAGQNVSSEHTDPLMAVIAEIERMAKVSNIKINDMRPHPNSQSRERIKEIGIELTVEGTMEGFMKFMYGLENSFLFLEINKLHLSNSKTDSSLLEGIFSLTQIVSN